MEYRPILRESTKAPSSPETHPEDRNPDMPHTPTISIRAATAADGRALMRLAALDSAPMPFGPTLLAEVDGTVMAAISLRDERVVADPFSRTADLVALLRMHAETVAAPAAGRFERLVPGRLGLAA